MSDVTSNNIVSVLMSDATSAAAEDSIARAQKLLAGISGGWQKAVGSALSRAAASGKTVAKTAVSKEYTISSGEFLRQTQNINHYVRETDGAVSVQFGFKGNVISLMKFRTSITQSGLVSTQVKRADSPEILNRAFRAKMGQHIGIYERIGVDRFPVQELYGPATPQMMYSNEEVTDQIEKKVYETYEKRIDHEIMRLLNGWGN